MIAKRARQFGMGVTVANRSPLEHSHLFDRSFLLDQLENFWRSADAFVVCVPLTAETHGIVDESAFRRTPLVRGLAYRYTPRYIYDLILAGDPDTLTTDLAASALDRGELLQSHAEALSSALSLASTLDVELDRERGLSANLKEQLHAERAKQRSAS
jgi:hypothetical protein